MLIGIIRHFLLQRHTSGLVRFVGKDSVSEKPEWIAKYSQKEMSSQAAIKKYVKPGDRIFIDSGCAEPLTLTQTLIELGHQLPDVEILHFLSLSNLDYYKTAGGAEDLFRHNAFFIGSSLRNAIREGQADYTPMLLSEIPRLFKTGRMHIDCVLIQVSPPDRNGFCSYGINVDIVKPIAEAADYVIAEINPKMPRTLGDSFIYMDDIDAFITSNNDLIEFSYEPPDEVSQKIAKYVASLVEDGSTIQMGIGSIPNAVTAALEDKRDLGIHSEVFSDGVVDLVEKGVVTCRKKTLHPGKIITSFVMGTKRLYDFVDDNPFVEFHPSQYVNDPFVIAQNEKQVAINAALTVDITGQCNSDSVGHQFYSGIGGQVDFIRGAAQAKLGNPIIALPSTVVLPTGEVRSRIVPFLEPGAGVVISRGDVHNVVTEWGIANLWGKSVRERVLQMINIAHPNFREALLKQAKDWHYIYSDQTLPASVDGRLSLYPEQYETSFITPDNKKIIVRPVKSTDERLQQELYYSLSERDRYYRFFTPVKDFRHKKIQPLVNVDYSRDMILVCSYTNPQGEESLIGTGGFFKTENPAKAELAFTTSESWREKGIAKFLLQYLIRIAREQGYRALNGLILLENRAMLHIMQSAGYKLVTKVDMGEIHFELDITKKSSEA
ncbi:MAG: acetyl-CoA hydrolase [Promethearchaeota archaeon CR_4]|nr:MAG: acetyl-CoA hydrolase [Candidatus Lokiarchaeota archaeon CR_4]